MGFIKRQLLKVIKWDDSSTTTIVYKYPMTDRDEIMNGCQLIVQESQVAMLVSSGQIADVYGPGTHKLTTNNMPIITKLASWKYGFDSPFKADVFYVNTKQFINMKWGTASKVPLRDADFGVIRVGARGTYSFKVEDASIFMREIFGTNREYTTNSLVEYFKSIIVSRFAESLAEAKVPALEIASNYTEIAGVMVDETAADFSRIGVKIMNIVVESIALPEEVEKAIDQRSSIGVLGGKLGEFTQYQTAQAIRDAANNPSGGAAGVGVGMGAGVAMGQAMGQAMNQSFQQPAQPQTTAPQPVQAQPTAEAICTNCGHGMPATAKFCGNCGTAVPQAAFCPNCGKKVAPGAKFCGDCGTKL